MQICSIEILLNQSDLYSLNDTADGAQRPEGGDPDPGGLRGRTVRQHSGQGALKIYQVKFFYSMSFVNFDIYPHSFKTFLKTSF